MQKREKTGNIKNNSKNNVRFLMFLRYIYREHFKVLNFLTITLQKCNNIIVYSKLILRKINSKFIKKECDLQIMYIYSENELYKYQNAGKEVKV